MTNSQQGEGCFKPVGLLRFLREVSSLLEEVEIASLAAAKEDGAIRREVDEMANHLSRALRDGRVAGSANE